jgi:steroid delta-isomerase-like uncharacterized protein
MSVEKNKAVIRRWIEARNANDVEAAVAQWADEQQEKLRSDFNRFTNGFPDIQVAVCELIAEGDKVAMWWTLHGTHLGTYAGVPATGKAIEWDGVDLYTMVDGKIAALRREARSLKDVLLDLTWAKTTTSVDRGKQR